MNTASIEKQMSKNLQGQRTEATTLFLKLVASHLVRESDLESNSALTISDDILLRADSEIAEELRDQIKEGYVIEDNIILCTTNRGSLIGMPVQHLENGPGERSIFLGAIFEAGAKIPKVGRVRAKFDEKGRIIGVSFTDSRNRPIANAAFVEHQVISSSPNGQVQSNRVTIYVDDIPWMWVDEAHLEFWLGVLGGTTTQF